MENAQDQKLISLASLVKSYVLTEKITKLYEIDQRQYSFIVDPKLNKPEIKKLLETLFSIKIKSIRTLNLFAQKKRVGKIIGKKARNKKVYISLEVNQKIDHLYS